MDESVMVAYLFNFPIYTMVVLLLYFISFLIATAAAVVPTALESKSSWKRHGLSSAPLLIHHLPF